MDKYLIKLKPSTAINSQDDKCCTLLSDPSTTTAASSSNAITKEDQQKNPVKITGRKFQENWKKTYPWIVYENEKVYCSICKAATASKFPVNSISLRDRDTQKAFALQGFCAWHKAIQRFKSHEKSDFHRHATSSCLEIGKGTNVSKSLSGAKSKEMKDARDALLRIISSLLYLAKQGLPIRGHYDDSNSNLHQLLALRSNDAPNLKAWLQRTKYKWLSHDVQNEILSMMAKEVQLELLAIIKNAIFYAIIMDETCDVSTQEQASICFRICDENFKVHEIFMGFYETPFTNSESLLCVIKDVLSRFGLNIANCRGQCYDGAANVSGHLSGLQSRVLLLEPRAIFIHCFAHTLNLVVQDTMGKVQAIRDYLSLVRELVSFVRGSPKRLKIFQTFQSNLDDTGVVALRPFCPTRWCLRVSSILSLEANYETVIEFLESMCKEASEAGGKANGFLKKIQEFEFFFMTKIVILVFQRVETLNATLQKASLSFQDAKSCIQNLISSIQTLRDSVNFDKIWEQVGKKAIELDLDDPVVPRIRKAARRFDDGSDPHKFRSPKERYRQIFFELVDNTTASLKTRFEKRTMEHLSIIENFALNKIGSEEQIVSFYGSDFDGKRLSLHRDMFWDIVNASSAKIESISDILEFFNREDQISLNSLIPEFCKLINLILTIPVTSCTAERSFSTLRRLKTYLRSTMKQQRLNDVSVLHVHKEIAAKLNIELIANEFIKRTQVRLNTFSMG